MDAAVNVSLSLAGQTQVVSILKSKGKAVRSFVCFAGGGGEG